MIVTNDYVDGNLCGVMAVISKCNLQVIWILQWKTLEFFLKEGLSLS